MPDTDLFSQALNDIRVAGISQIEKIKYVAEAAYGYNLLIIHLDADSSDRTNAYKQRFIPGVEAVRSDSGRYNLSLVPLIPVRNMNAWLMVDFTAFRDIVGTDFKAVDLGFPAQADAVEKIGDPKSVFADALRQARPSRRRPILPSEVFTSLANKIDLTRLEQVPAYQDFKNNLRAILYEQHYL